MMAQKTIVIENDHEQIKLHKEYNRIKQQVLSMGCFELYLQSEIDNRYCEFYFYYQGNSYEFTISSCHFSEGRSYYLVGSSIINYYLTGGYSRFGYDSVNFEDLFEKLTPELKEIFAFNLDLFI